MALHVFPNTRCILFHSSPSFCNGFFRPMVAESFLHRGNVGMIWKGGALLAGRRTPSGCFCRFTLVSFVKFGRAL